jgi:hypothetical protein
MVSFFKESYPEMKIIEKIAENFLKKKETFNCEALNGSENGSVLTFSAVSRA